MKLAASSIAQKPSGEERLKMIMMVRVKSELLKAVDYNPSTSTLTVAFDKGGALYQYSPFTSDDWADFCVAKSKGKHFLAFIKPRFECKKLNEEESSEYGIEEEETEPGDDAA
jgi:KTSC domain